MPISDYRFPRQRSKEDLKQTATRMLIDENRRPSDYRTSGSETAKAVASKWDAAVAARAQEIKESRDPKLQRKQQLAKQEASMSKADKELFRNTPATDERGVLSPELLWNEEPGMARTTYTERTGKKMGIPEGMQVGAKSREVMTPEGGMVRQIAGAGGYGSTKLNESQANALAEQRANEEDRFIRRQQALASAREARVQREKAAGAESLAKRQGWEEDKRAFAEGQQIQRESRKALTRVNRALTGAPAFDRYGRTAAYGQALSPTEWQDLMDQKAALEANIAAKETLKEKGVTELGKKATAGRTIRAWQMRALANAENERARSADYGIVGIRASGQMIDPTINMMAAAYPSMFSNFNGAFGVAYPGLTYPEGAATK